MIIKKTRFTHHISHHEQVKVWWVLRNVEKGRKLYNIDAVASSVENFGTSLHFSAKEEPLQVLELYL